MLILLCGIPASGKSTYRANLEFGKPTAIVLSSDELRGVIGKDENDQSVSHIVFRTMENMTKYFLRRGKTVIIDAQNRTVKARNSFLDIARELRVKTEAVVFCVSLEEALRRNAQRERQVPNEVIERAFNDFYIPMKGEVDSVVYVENP